ncbi:MAG: DUF1800 family protein [Cyclobacteriaceae bacterium]
MASISSIYDKLGKKRAAHLLRRATFGATKQQIDDFAQLSPQLAVEFLFPAETALPPPPLDPATGQSWLNPAPTEGNSGTEDLLTHLKCWWIHQMCSSPLNAVEKLTFFLHTHFTNMASRMRYAPAFYYQVQLFRFFALGNFKTLTKKICLDNAMLRFLDGHLNEVGRPNENFAREFFELYTIGKGASQGPNDYTTFTEDDILEAARIFSGCKEDKEFTNIDPETGFSQAIMLADENGLAIRHDAGLKQFSAAFAHAQILPTETINNKATTEAAIDEINQLVEMVFDQEATAKHICRKLYRFFVYYEINEEIEQQVIQPLAAELKSANYELMPVLKLLFTSAHFYDMDNGLEDDNNLGAIIKSPLDLVVGTFRFLQHQMPDPQAELQKFYEAYQEGVLKPLLEQGLDFCEPYDVAGYDAYHQGPVFHRNWISTNFLARRYEFSRLLIEGVSNREDELLYKFDIVQYVQDPANVSDPENPELLVRELLDYMLPEEITEERFQYFLKVILLDNLSEINWRFEWQGYIKSGDDSAVRVQLENLLHTIIQSPEYQLS